MVETGKIIVTLATIVMLSIMYALAKYEIEVSKEQLFIERALCLEAQGYK